MLAALGMQEIITYPLTSRQVLERVVPPEQLDRAEPLAVVNPLNVGEERLRTSLRGSVLSTVAANQRLQQEAFSVFETSRVYFPGEELPEEIEHLVGAVTGRRVDRWGRATDAWVDFFEAKGFLERLFDRLAVSVSYQAVEEYGMIPGRTAEVSRREHQDRLHRPSSPVDGESLRSRSGRLLIRGDARCATALRLLRAALPTHISISSGRGRSGGRRRGVDTSRAGPGWNSQPPARVFRRAIR